MKHDHIVIKHANVHNLKAIDLSIPKEKLVLITGPSGSGKSSLAFDTIYAECHRRFVESLSTHARQFLDVLDKPDVESIEGLSPAIAIEQKSLSRNPRSTVGTISDVYDLFRLFFARLGTPHCYQCKCPIIAVTNSQIIKQVLEFPPQSKLSILSPILRDRPGDHQSLVRMLLSQGFARARWNGTDVRLEDITTFDPHIAHNLDLYIDRIVLKDGVKRRLADAIELSTALSQGLVQVLCQSTDEKDSTYLFNTRFACTNCHITLPDIEPRIFSFNSPHGACSNCAGLGYQQEIDRTALPLSDEIEDDETQSESPSVLDHPICPACKGSRLNLVATHVRFLDHNIASLSDLSIAQALMFFRQLPLNTTQKLIAEKIMREILSRLTFLKLVGVDYLSISRPVITLSGGEGRRIRLANQIGSALSGVIYILDEPSIGLHAHDHAKLLGTLTRLRDQGNTVIVVEHDLTTISQADHVIELGPQGGRLGGKIIATGTPQQITDNLDSLTGCYLSGAKTVRNNHLLKPGTWGWVKLEGCKKNNLQNITVKFPLGCLTCVTGVSGSGKSTLVMDVLYHTVVRRLNRLPGKYKWVKKASGLEKIDKLVHIDQSSIGRSPRSNPASFTGIFTHVRQLFSQVKEAKIRGYLASRFSFNIKGGRCEACHGAGVKQIEMHFLPDVYITCPDCQGQRFNQETLEIYYKGKTIAQILQMTVEEALIFFQAIPPIAEILGVLQAIGLGYLTIGQSSATLSGGEAQRIKLSRALAKRDTGNTLFVLDEPTAGLHLDDTQKLIDVLLRLRDKGNTVVIIEHDLHMINCADYVIDLGPGGGINGGNLIASMVPKKLPTVKDSLTGQCLLHLFQ